jgi:hypothetical protein
MIARCFVEHLLLKEAIEIRCFEILGQQQTISRSHTIIGTVKITISSLYFV